MSTTSSQLLRMNNSLRCGLLTITPVFLHCWSARQSVSSVIQEIIPKWHRMHARICNKGDLLECREEIGQCRGVSAGSRALISCEVTSEYTQSHGGRLTCERS
ncbi:uncharacterized protein LAESUDRAFT_733134 [Laetiporus sulphureus 93-53]|uniref:Uncharacterized protein n=1 Tax=Laetiporus sulphureus 93-53 TaxID=1314785 RepID=A0A165AP08_9APHY|nr:uncharacterized protein LAESUDRAFT_733134 [Laetiporus sulphureus 93-53]KZS99380.1 hypothetical protein LAESUDRAFT_733134 [Laetiporus sulphureus 93-53]